MRRSTKLSIGAVGLTALAAALLAPSALADTAPQTGDAVIVGSDTLQFAGDFVADGSPSDTGYNSNSPTNRIFDFFATGDANGRYVAAGGTAGAPSTGSGTAILRAGTLPVQRPNGSGAGVGALIADSPGGTGYRGLPFGSINAVRMSRLPNSVSGNTEDATCDANTTGCGGLHVYEIGYDGLTLAQLTTGSDVVPLDADTLWHVYNCDTNYTNWNSSMIGGTSGDAIAPLLPQSGSGTRTFFLNTIDAAHAAAVGGGAAATDPPNLGNCAITVQEHDPSPFTTGVTRTVGSVTTSFVGKQEVEPFSAARLTLINADGYFANSGTANGSGTRGAGTAAAGYGVNTIEAVPAGNNPVSGLASFSDTRSVYLTVRQKDVNATCSGTACFKTGGTKNIVNTLISGGSTSVFRAGLGAQDIADAGFTAHFQDCGQDPDQNTSSCATSPTS